MDKYKAKDITNIDRNMVVHNGIERERICYIISSPDERPLWLANFGITPPTPEYHIKRDKCGYFVLEYVYTGRGTVINNGKTHTVEAGDVYLLTPGSEHEYFADPADPYGKYWVNFRGEFMHTVLQAYKIDNQTVFKGVDLKRQFERLFALEEYSRENDLLYCKASAIIFEMLMLCAEKSGEDHSAPYYAGQLRILLDHAVTKHESLDSMCKRLFISKSFAIKEFKKYYRCTPHEYLLNKRLELAKRLLTESDRPIGEISEALCFSDAHYFSGLFKEKVGMGPKQYRATHSTAGNRGVP